MTAFRIVKFLLVTAAIVVAVVVIAALSLRLYGGLRFYDAAERYEAEVGPLAVATFVRPPIPEEDNAVTWLRPGVLAVVLFPPDRGVVGTLAAKPFAAWSPDDAGKLDAILERNKAAIELLERARGMKRSNWEIHYDEGSAAKLPNLLAALNASKLLAARGRAALARGDRDTALRSVETLGALARSHEAESATIMLVIGLAIERLELALVHELIASPAASPAELVRSEAALCDEDLAKALRRSLRGSAAALVNDLNVRPAIRDEFTSHVHGAIHRRLAGILTKLLASAALEAHRDAEKSLGAPVRAPLDDEPAEDRKPSLWQRLHAAVGLNGGAVPAPASPTASSRDAARQAITKSSLWQGMYDLVSPNLESVSARATATASSRELAMLAIALRKEASASGRYPEALPAISGIPERDPLTGDPRAYALRADGSAEVRATTTPEIVRSIFPVGQIAFDALYTWTLPRPRGGR